MACSAKRSDEGYATVAATVIAMAISIVVIAVSLTAQQELRTATRALERAKVEAELDGAQLLSAVTVMRDGGSGRYRWRIDGAAGWIELLAENESAKLPLSRVPDLSDEDLARFDVVVPERLRTRVRGVAATQPSATDTGQLDTSRTWRQCAASMISPYGRAGRPRLDETIMPAARKFDWLAGQVWRLRARSADGWTEERIVRFTGEPNHPAAIVERRLLRDGEAGEPCSRLIG